MKISNANNFIADVVATVLFFIGVTICLKIGFVQWVMWCTFLWLFILRDEEFINSIMPMPDMNFTPIYLVMWMMSVLMPIIVIMTYLASRLSGYRDYDD